MQTIICSHGFGVRLDARGMFTEIQQALPNDQLTMFDYNDFDAEGNVVVLPLDEQAERLQHFIDRSPKGSILLCHSQGSIIAGLVNLSRISKVILLAPPVKMSMERVIEKMMDKQGSVLNLQGVSRLPRSDGSITLVPRAYVESLRSRDPLDIYAKVAADKPTTIIRALDDEVLGLTNVDKVEKADVIDIHADHNFTGTSRHELIDILRSVISS
ncbi:MAG: Alpha/beta fold hydrolase [Patescibacteria group bacterium]|nr:Alpha/beta fold hydrolase [Patescibacteria group bacterium]